jgi:glycoprotein 3-alpha-L-fucosyltransferase
MGARPEDYAEMLPPHSYIHVDDFRSPKDLANYLRMLDANDTLYNEYFRWKHDWRVTIPHWPSVWCRLCALLHTTIMSQPPFVHWYKDYPSWWNGACNAKWVKQTPAAKHLHSWPLRHWPSIMQMHR